MLYTNTCKHLLVLNMYLTTGWLVVRAMSLWADVGMSLNSAVWYSDPLQGWAGDRYHLGGQGSGVTCTCSASISLGSGDVGAESCSSDGESASWSLSSIATGAAVHSAISNQREGGVFCLRWGGE